MRQKRHSVNSCAMRILLDLKIVEHVIQQYFYAICRYLCVVVRMRPASAAFSDLSRKPYGAAFKSQPSP